MGGSSLDEEERFVQMVRDFIESEPTPVVPVNNSSIPMHQSPSILSLQKMLEEVSADETEVLEKILFFLKDMGENKNIKKFIVWKLKGEGYEASVRKTSWISNFEHPSGDYEYIGIMMGNENGTAKPPTRLIVDMDFRSQFELARPTATYTELTNALPSIFVGTEEKLNKILSLLCSAAKESLRDSGLHIPPWRKLSYMKSKWLLSENCKEVSFPPAGRDNGSTICGSPKFSYLKYFGK